MFAKKYVNLQSINRVYMKSENLIPSSFHDETQAKSVFQNFYTRYYRMLVGYAMSFVKSEGDAEDIVHKARRSEEGPHKDDASAICQHT